VDYLLHGADGLRSWSTSATPDPILYRVTGFDHTRREYSYAVNPRFGQTRATRDGVHGGFGLTIEASFDLGRDIRLQQLERSLKPGRNGYPGTRLAPTAIRRRYARNVPNPYAEILAESDSLLLSPTQQNQLQGAADALRARTDSVWLDLAQYLSGLGDEYDVRLALARQETAIRHVWVLAWEDVRRSLPTMLTPIQLALLPGTAAALLRSEVPYYPSGRTISR